MGPKVPTKYHFSFFCPEVLPWWVIFFQNIYFFCFFHQKNISIFLEAKTKELNAILYISINSPLTVYAQFANVFMKKMVLKFFLKKEIKNFFLEFFFIFIAIF